MSSRTAARPATSVGRGASGLDERLTIAAPLRRTLNKVFPDHWSFLLGEIALYSFIILLLTGTYLTFFFDASMQEIAYEGSYAPLRGIEMSRAYATSLDISFDVRGGLLIRQIHHWAALLFVASIVVHLMRTFFTGAFRKPREANWVIGVGLLVLGLLEGVFGYSLTDDLLSGTGLRIINAIFLSIPVVGTWLSFAIFDGEFPGTVIIGRFYILHVLLIPGILLALISAHLLLVVKNKHTQYPGAGRTEDNVVGKRMFPVFAAKSTGFFMVVFGILAALGGLVQINPIWLYGPYNPSQVSAGSQPDWYIGFLDGSTRLFPPWDINLFGYNIPPLFWPTIVLPGLLFTLLALYPFIEATLTKDREYHNLLQRPRDVPVRTAIGAMALSFYVVLWISGGNDLIADKFNISLNAMTWIGRIGLIVVPPIAYWVAYRMCLGLQMHDREVLEHGVETGIIRRLPHGEFIEVHQPLGQVDAHGHGSLQYGGAPVPKRMNHVGGMTRAVKGFFTPLEEPPARPVTSEDEKQAELTGSGRPKAPEA
jgi:ubiquinol-cytochrome c reductase cytochrome b subunit